MAALVAIAAALFGVWWVRRRRRRQSASSGQSSHRLVLLPFTKQTARALDRGCLRAGVELGKPFEKFSDGPVSQDALIPSSRYQAHSDPSSPSVSNDGLTTASASTVGADKRSSESGASKGARVKFRMCQWRGVLVLTLT